MTWRRCRLDWLATEERGGINPAEISADTVFHYSIPALDEIGDGRLEPPEDIGSGKLLLSGGEILVSKLNPRLPRVLLADSHDVPTLASTEFIALRPGPDVDERFLRYWLGSEPLRQTLSGATMSVTRSQQRVRPEIVTKIWLTVPGIDEQRAIADYLDTETARIDALIAKKHEMIGLARERLVVERCHELRAAVNSVTIPLRRLVTCLDSQRVPLNREERSSKAGPYPYWGAGGILDHVDDYLFNEPLVLLGEDGAPFFDDQRDVAFVVDGPVWVNNHVHVLACNRAADPGWLRHMLNAVDYRVWITGSTRDKLTQEEMMAIRVPLLSTEEQRTATARLATFEESATKLTDLMERQVSRLQEHRQALITAAVTGELSIPGVAA